MSRTRAVQLSIAGALLFLAGCGSSSSSAGPLQVTMEKEVDGALAAAQYVALIGENPELLAPQEIIDAPQADGDTLFYRKVFTWLGSAALDPYWVNAKVVNYRSRVVGQDGAPGFRTLGGAVFIPEPKSGHNTNPVSAPIILYTHGTELVKTKVASTGVVRGGTGYDEESGGGEGLVGFMGAALGHAIVLMPDLPGMGLVDGPKAYHPYCQRESLAYAGIDMVKAVIEEIQKQDGKLLPTGVTWNGKVYVMGYSEGGFAAMAVTREWQLSGGLEQNGFTLHCSAPLAGPHDLTGQMVPLMTNPDATYKAPFFLPYVLKGYGSIYPSIDIQAAIRKPYLDAGLASAMDGKHEGSDVDELIWDVYDWTHWYRVVMREVMNETWVTSKLLTETSDVYLTLKANNTIADPDDAPNAWKNGMPMLIIHSEYDKLVPPGNSDNARAWLANPDHPITSHGVSPAYIRPDHAAAGMLALPGALYWLMNGCQD